LARATSSKFIGRKLQHSWPRHFGGASNLVATLSNLVESSNKIENLKLESTKQKVVE
jgi:hypothetical protein